MIVDPKEKVSLLQRVHMFRDLDEQVLEQVAAFVEAFDYAAGETIFQQGDAPDYFHIIFSGQVKILKVDPTQPQPVLLGILEDGDYFGQEIINLTWPRAVTATAETPATTLRVSVTDFRKILAIVPSVGPRLQMILDSYRLMLRSKFKWLEENEYIYYIARRHPFFLIWKIVAELFLIGIASFVFVFLFFSIPTPITGGILMLVSIISLASLLWTYVDWTNDYFVITSRRALYQERVVLLYDSLQETPLDQIQSSSSNTTQWGRIIGYGNVIIRSFFSTILFKEMAYPAQVMLLLQDRQFHAQTYQRWTELKSVRQRLDQRFVKGPKMPDPPKPPRRDPRPDPLKEFISTFLNVRYEVAGSIVYRTHPLLLLQKVFIPLLLLIALGAAFLFNWFSDWFLPPGAACTLSALVAAVLIAWFFYRYYDWHYDVYIVSGDQIVDVNKKPLGHEDRRAAPLDRIQNIEYQQRGIVALLLNYGTVFVQVGDQRFSFDDVHRPAEVQRELFRKLNERKRKMADQQAETDRRRLEDWIATYDEMKSSGQLDSSPPPKTRPGF